MVRAALDDGCRTVVLGIGGSASTDGGAGMLQALGARLLDAAGRPLGPGGAALANLASVDLAGLHPALAETRVIVASDVDNPLLGPNGAAAVYGPQKGASVSDVAVLDAALARWADVAEPAAADGDRTGDRATGGDRASAVPPRDRPGAGAAGGVGFAAMAVLGAELQPGIRLVLDLVGFDRHLPGATLVVTGEGSLDAQTLSGKAPAGVAAAATAAGIPVVTVSGRLELTADQLREAGIRQAYALTDIEPDPRRCLAEAGPLLQTLSRSLAKDWLTSPGGPDDHQR